MLIHTAITGDSFKVLAQKAYGSCVTIKKNPKSYFLTSGDIFAPLYSTLHYLWFDMQHNYVCTKFILDPSGPCPQRLYQILNVFLQSSSLGLSPVKVSVFSLKWYRSNGMTLQTDVRTDGGVSQYTTFQHFLQFRNNRNKYQHFGCRLDSDLSSVPPAMSLEKMCSALCWPRITDQPADRCI